MKRIFLIGFMGSGKTHWGKLLAEKTGTPFFDLDEVIVKTAGKSIADIFSNDGEEYFRYKEKEILEQLVADHESCVISCGGGTPCFFNNIDFMKKEGEVIWLNTNLDVLVQRLVKEKQQRPLLKMIPDSELKTFIFKKLQDRRLYYEQADITIKEENLSIDRLAGLLSN
jgi:shikimate kinase